MTEEKNIYSEIKNALGYQYARKILENLDGCTVKDIYSLFGGEMNDLEKEKKILEAARVAIVKLNSLQEEVANLKSEIFKN